MKQALGLIALFACINCFGQKKKAAPIKYRDSVYYEMDFDTMYGKISYPVGEGSVSGDGMMVHYKHFEVHRIIPDRPPQQIKDSKGRVIAILMTTYDGSEINEGNEAYIKSSGQWKRIDGKFTFIPN